MRANYGPPRYRFRKTPRGPVAISKFLVFLLLPFLCHGQENNPHKAAVYRGFEGGLNDTTAPIYLKPNESPHLENFYLDDVPGALVTRKGYTKCGNIPSGNTTKGIWKYTSNAGTSAFVVSDGANFYETQN